MVTASGAWGPPSAANPDFQWLLAGERVPSGAPRPWTPGPRHRHVRHRPGSWRGHVRCPRLRSCTTERRPVTLPTPTLSPGPGRGTPQSAPGRTPRCRHRWPANYGPSQHGSVFSWQRPALHRLPRHGPGDRDLVPGPVQLRKRDRHGGAGGVNDPHRDRIGGRPGPRWALLFCAVTWVAVTVPSESVEPCTETVAPTGMSLTAPACSVRTAVVPEVLNGHRLAVGGGQVDGGCRRPTSPSR